MMHSGRRRAVHNATTTTTTTTTTTATTTSLLRRLGVLQVAVCVCVLAREHNELYDELERRHGVLCTDSPLPTSVV